jgi:hypothetical protein
MKLSLLVSIVFQGVMQIERSRRGQHARQASGIWIAFSTTLQVRWSESNYNSSSSSNDGATLRDDSFALD